MLEFFKKQKYTRLLAFRVPFFCGFLCPSHFRDLSALLRTQLPQRFASKKKMFMPSTFRVFALNFLEFSRLFALRVPVFCGLLRPSHFRHVNALLRTPFDSKPFYSFCFPLFFYIVHKLNGVPISTVQNKTLYLFFAAFCALAISLSHSLFLSLSLSVSLSLSLKLDRAGLN
jgi:hypothetical protein